MIVKTDRRLQPSQVPFFGRRTDSRLMNWLTSVFRRIIDHSAPQDFAGFQAGPELNRVPGSRTGIAASHSGRESGANVRA